MSNPIQAPQSAQTWAASSLGPRQRALAWERLGAEQFDVVVIGGGVVGTGCALDAATRGLKVALVEARDFACACGFAKEAHGAAEIVVHQLETKKEIITPNGKPYTTAEIVQFHRNFLLWFAKSHAEYIGLKSQSMYLTSSTQSLFPA